MMMRRRRGVGLIGVAAVAGTAAYAGKKSAEAQAQEQAQNQQIADLQAQQAATGLRPASSGLCAGTCPGSGSRRTGGERCHGTDRAARHRCTRRA